MSRIAFFGPQGTFTEQAARTLCGPGDELLPFDTVPLALEAVRAGTTDAACVPVENSVEGPVNATLDGLSEDDPVVAVAEALLPVRFSVLTGASVTEAGEVRTVASHPHALAQVRRWLRANLPQARQVAAASTAAAAAGVRDGAYDAAICAPVAAEHYPLRELATGVADEADAHTRFLLLRPPGELPAPTGADRTSVVASTGNRTGALADLLTELALRGINLTRLDARPLRGNYGEYRFFIDVDGHVAEPWVGEALAALHRRCTRVRFLGSHPKADGPTVSTTPPVRAPDVIAAFAAADRWLESVRKGTLA